MKDSRQKLFLSVYGVDNIKAISILFKKDYIKIKNKKNGLDKALQLFQKYVLAITYMYSVTTMKTNLTLFRNVIKQEGGLWEKTVMDTFKIYDIYKVISETTASKMEKKEEDKKELEFNVKTEIKSIKKILKDDSYDVKPNQDRKQVRSYYIAYLLGLTGGERFTEAFKTTTIKKFKGKYYFHGLLKKHKDDEAKREANLLYISVDEYKSYSKELRRFLNAKLKTTKKTSLKELSIGEVNATFSKVYNNAIKRITNGAIPNFHELRHYYAIEGTELFRIGNESDKDVRYRILGHHSKGDSTRTYSTIK